MTSLGTLLLLTSPLFQLILRHNHTRGGHGQLFNLMAARIGSWSCEASEAHPQLLSCNLPLTLINNVYTSREGGIPAMSDLCNWSTLDTSLS